MQLELEGCGRRAVVAAFDAPSTTSDAGVLLLRAAANRLALWEQVAECFDDHRDPDRIDHTVAELIAQRVLGIGLGYEDLNDHAFLRDDRALAVAINKIDPSGQDRRRSCDVGQALASPATLNRLENTPSSLDAKRPDLKLVHHPEKFEALFVDLFLDAHETPPEQIILDFDATDDPIHGRQEGAFFHGYYDRYCYLPLYVFCGDFPLVAKLRTADRDGASGALEEAQRLVAHIHKRWPETRILLRADSGFARDALMAWCEDTPRVDFLFGLARNNRLKEMVKADLDAAREESEETGRPARRLKELVYETLKSWTRPRRVVAKAEVLVDRDNPRFVVTSLPIVEASTERVYCELYCARGDMENRIKEQQLGLFADRTSAHRMRTNQLRLWFSTLACVVINEVRRIGLVGTDYARATALTLRARLFKIGALVRVSCRRIKLSISQTFPLQSLFTTALTRLAPEYPLRANR